MRARFLMLFAAAASLSAACAIPGGAAWSDLHASAFGSVMAAAAEAEGTDVTVDDASGGGFDFRGDIDVERKREAAVLYGARVGFAPLEFSVSQFGYDGSNDGQVIGATRYAGVPITGDLLIGTELDLAVTKFTAGLDILNTPVARIGLIGGLDYVEFDRFDLIAREAKSGGGGGSVAIGDVQTILEDEATVVPMLGLRGDVRLPYLGRVGAELSGLKADFDDADILYLDFDLAAHWQAWGQIEIVFGYRAVRMDVEGPVGAADLDVEVNLEGPYAGLSFYW